MNKHFLSVIGFLFIAVQALFSQNAQPDSMNKGGAPLLEIPEITIVGKKAITLPFARKGEIYDVNIYQAPPPDSTLLGERLATAMPVGLMPRDEEKRTPFHTSVEGAFGSFSTGKLRAYADYTRGLWKFSGNIGFGTTEGHTDNAKGSLFDINATAQTLLKTDNNVLKSLAIIGGIGFSTETYGMFAYPDAERSRRNFTITASLGSIDRRDITIDLGISTNFRNVTDTYQSAESEASAVAPLLTSAFGINLGKTRWETNVAFRSLSLDYSIPTQSVTLFTAESDLQWNVSERWKATAGFIFADGSDMYGIARTLAMPTLSLHWKTAEQQQFSFWWKPMMELHTYDDWMRYNPYLTLSPDISPDRAPINIGINYTFTSRTITFDAGLSYTQYSNKAVVNGMGIINPAVAPFIFIDFASLRNSWLSYYEADQIKFDLACSYKPNDNIRMNISNRIQPTYATGSSDQLPMTPLVTMNGGIEYDLPKPITLRASFDYWSVRNNNLSSSPTDIFLLKELDGAFLLNVGASTSIVPRTMISVSINNLLGTSYDWWSDYPAPGLQFSLSAKVNLR